MTIGDARGAAILDASATAARDRARDAALLAAARASGGVFTSETALVDAVATRFPPTVVVQRARPARSPWWAVAFAGCLCIEWIARRRRGLP